MFNNSLKKFLIDNPQISSLIISGSITFTGDAFMSLLSSYTKDGFKVSSFVDDDNLTEEELYKHHEELADQALKIIYERMLKGV